MLFRSGDACHVWVQALEHRTEFTDAEWAMLPSPPSPKAARGAPIRDALVDGDHVVVGGEEVDVPFKELGARLEEAAVVRVLAALVKPEGFEGLWAWEKPIIVLPAPGGDAPP